MHEVQQTSGLLIQPGQEGLTGGHQGQKSVIVRFRPWLNVKLLLSPEFPLTKENGKFILIVSGNKHIMGFFKGSSPSLLVDLKI
jgi:hypothetical protein